MNRAFRFETLTLALLVLLIVAAGLSSQTVNATIVQFTGNPATGCTIRLLGIDITNKAFWVCSANVWFRPWAAPGPPSAADQLPLSSASGAATWVQINGNASCGDGTHALNFTAGTPGSIGCQTLAGGGSTVTAAPPYLNIAGTKYVAATMWPFTAFFTGSWLDTHTCTLTAGTNGSELVSCSLAGTNAWYSTTATTSVEAELLAARGSNNISNIPSAGVWICDTTNGKLYALEVVIQPSGTTANQFLQLSIWTLAACAGTPSAPSVPVVAAVEAMGVAHLQLLKSGGNLLTRYSLDGGQTYVQLDSRAVGTLSNAGVTVRDTGTDTNTATYLSVSIT